MKTQLFLRNLCIAILLFTSSCQSLFKEKEEDPNEYVVDWIEANMDYWYYWENRMPAERNKALPPQDFFYSLLYSGDRFSWIQDNFIELLQSLQGVSKEGGYEIKLYLESASSDNVIAQIMYVKEGSPADNAGLMRGDVIFQVNGAQLTLNNYQQILNRDIKESHRLAFRRYDSNEDDFVAQEEVDIVTQQIAENPNYMDTVFHIEGRKIGYYVYNLFSTGPIGGSTVYNDEMDAIFANFQAEGIDELILDLRFNSGGAESATINLASLVGKGVNSTETFVRREYNEGVESEIINDPRYGEEFLVRKFTDKAQNIGDQLASSRVYVLTTSRSASASELLINGLKPFMEVVIVGDTTAGKNLGSISIYEDDNPDNQWGMQPIVTKSFNKLDQSDYDVGFFPDVPILDNNLILYPLGDTRERLLEQALIHMGAISPPVARWQKEQKYRIGGRTASSLDKKAYSGKLIIDDEKLRELFR